MYHFAPESSPLTFSVWKLILAGRTLTLRRVSPKSIPDHRPFPLSSVTLFPINKTTKRFSTRFSANVGHHASTKTSSDGRTCVMDIGMTMSEVASTRKVTLQTLIINKSLWHDRVIDEWIPDSSFDRASPISNANTTQSHLSNSLGNIGDGHLGVIA